MQGVVSTARSAVQHAAHLRLRDDISSRPMAHRVIICSSSGLNRPNRPAQSPSRPQLPARSPGQQPRPSRGNILSLTDAVSGLQRLWQQIPLVTVPKDPTTGLCLKPAQHGKLGKQVLLLTNHFGVVLSGGTVKANKYTVSIVPKGPTTAGGDSTKQSSKDVTPLDVRQQIIQELARQQSWAADSWQFDPSSNRLFSLDPLTSGDVDIQLSSAAGQSGKKRVGPGGTTEYQVTVTPAPASLAPAAPDTLDLLGLVMKASLVAALPQPVIQTARSFLLQQAATPSGPAAAGRGGGRGGGRSGRSGRGPGAGRGGTSNAASSTGALQFWEGIRSGIKLCESSQPDSARLDLQLDKTAGGVVPAGPLSDLVLVGGVRSPADLVGNKGRCRQAEEVVKNLKVQVDYYSTGPRSRKVQGLDSRTPQQYKFEARGATTTVAKYFQTTYPQLKLKHLHDWPCVMVSKTAAIPLELCRVTEPQARSALSDRQTADLIRVAALPPERRLKSLQEIVRQQLVNFKLPLLQQWGIGVDPKPLMVPGRILPDAKLQYTSSGAICADAGNTGQWRQSGYLRPAQLRHWAVLNLAGQEYAAGVNDFVTELVRQLQQQGGTASKPRTVDGSASAVQSSVQRAVEAAAELPANVQLLLVVLPNDKGQTYSEVKTAASTLGVVTQCLVASKAGVGPASRGSNIKPQYVGNILLKINHKAGGTNWQLPQGPETWAAKLGTKQLMVLGIDVGHGIAGGGGNKPSTAAVVGSLDRSCMRYGAFVMEQTAGEEIVLGLQEAVQQLLRDRFSAMPVAGQAVSAAAASGGLLPVAGLPECLVVYRDGVSDSQYAAVLQEEVSAVRQACAATGGPNYKPKLTFVVVSKSHGTRLFPHPQDSGSSDASVGGRSGNVVPGTAVDTLITAPLKYEFFLNSHAGIQGTNRPGRYNVLVDEAGLGFDGLQLVTQHLASTYCACTRTISCPAPARYADKAARVAGAGGPAGSWQVVQAAAPGIKAREYRVLDVQKAMAGKMWFV